MLGPKRAEIYAQMGQDGDRTCEVPNGQKFIRVVSKVHKIYRKDDFVNKFCLHVELEKRTKFTERMIS